MLHLCIMKNCNCLKTNHYNFQQPPYFVHNHQNIENIGFSVRVYFYYISYANNIINMLFSMIPIDFTTIISNTAFGLENPNSSKKEENPEKTSKKQTEKIHSTFRLPMEYLDKSEVFALSPIVASDLELVESTSQEGKPIYDSFFQTKHDFAKNIVSDIGSHYTTNIDYLKDTQHVIRDTGDYIEKMKSDIDSHYSVPCDKIMTIWKDLKEDDDFLDKYSYMEWSMLKHLNESSTFLQCLSIISIVSPLLSLVLPLLFLLFPFVILKLQGIPITFSIYLDVLRDIAKNHFIGKLFTMDSFTWDRIAYLLVSLGLYGFQIYQNITSCFHFYENTKKINTHLFEMKQYVGYSITSMQTFLDIHKNKCFYWQFCQETEKHLVLLRKLNTLLQSIQPFKHSVSKFNELGHMMKCFYELHANTEYETSLRYSIGFEGYIQNILGIHENLVLGHVNFATFERDASGNMYTNFQGQFYPVLKEKEPVPNNCDLSKNMIVTGPNASGKTTFLKTTMLNILFSQQFGCGFYQSANVAPYTHIHSYLNIPDTSERDSLFQAESRRCKEILDIIETSSGSPNVRHFCIFDELYSGTNPGEATKSGYSFLKYLSKIENVDFILTTHYVSICDKLKKHKKIQNYKMFVENLEDGTVKYTYKIKKGISKQNGAIHILKEMNYPQEIIDSFENC